MATALLPELRLENGSRSSRVVRPTVRLDIACHFSILPLRARSAGRSQRFILSHAETSYPVAVDATRTHRW
jgi:hypothetical protein